MLLQMNLKYLYQKIYIMIDTSYLIHGRKASVIAERVFRNNLNYINASGNQVIIRTNSAEVVKEYIRGTGKNYALVTFSHGDDGAFTMGTKNGVDQWIAWNNNSISGYWHLIFINSCSSMASDKLAQAFKTIGYSNRAALGWYQTIQIPAFEEWWGNFEKYAGNYGLREAALKAANDCTRWDTPIRLYGDGNWNGKAW